MEEFDTIDWDVEIPDGNDLYDHEKANSFIDAVIELAKDMEVNLLELKHACTCISVVANQVLVSNFEEAIGEVDDGLQEGEEA